MGVQKVTQPSTGVAWLQSGDPGGQPAMTAAWKAMKAG